MVGAVMTSAGSGTSTRSAIPRAVSTSDASASDAPTGRPAARANVLAIPPPTISRSAISASDSSNSSLVETFAPPMIATNGRDGDARARPSAASSAASNGPAQAAGACLATPWVDACARWAVANASITNRSHRLARSWARPLSFAPSPGSKRTFSSKTTAPGDTSTPPRQSRTTGTAQPSACARCAATGDSDSAGSNSPSFGRPRCDMTITAAPRSMQVRIVGKAATIRASLATFPSLKGTLKSSRISTRLPESA